MEEVRGRKQEKVKGSGKGRKGAADSGKTGLGRGFSAKEGTHSSRMCNLETAQRKSKPSRLGFVSVLFSGPGAS